MNEMETTFVQTFISRDKRDRWLTLLGSDKNRHKVLQRLAHVGIDDLDPRFAHDKAAIPADVEAQAKCVYNDWVKHHPQKICYIIANSDADGTTMRLEEADSDSRLTTGAIIILVPNRLAYYHTERSNLNKQPFYLLYHP